MGNSPPSSKPMLTVAEVPPRFRGLFFPGDRIYGLTIYQDPSGAAFKVGRLHRDLWVDRGGQFELYRPVRAEEFWEAVPYVEQIHIWRGEDGWVMGRQHIQKGLEVPDLQLQVANLMKEVAVLKSNLITEVAAMKNKLHMA